MDVNIQVIEVRKLRQSTIAGQSLSLTAERVAGLLRNMPGTLSEKVGKTSIGCYMRDTSLYVILLRMYRVC